MLSSGPGRGAIRLLHKSSSTTQYRAELSALTSRRVLPAYSALAGQSSSDIPLRITALPFRIHRTLATQAVSKPKAHTGRPKAAKTKATKTTTEKPKPIKNATKKPKAKPKTKVKAKAKPKAKPKSARKPKKVLTPEQKKEAQIKELKKVAFKTPRGLPTTAFLVVCSEMAKATGRLSGKEASEKYANLLPEEKEHYNSVANKNKQANQIDYTKLVESHTPIQIRNANIARGRLTRLGVKGYKSKLVDERIPKGRVGSLALFMQSRYNSGDMHGIAFRDAAKIIGREWKELPESQKKPFYEAEAEDRKRYVAEMKSIGIDVKSRESTTAAARAA